MSTDPPCDEKGSPIVRLRDLKARVLKRSVEDPENHKKAIKESGTQENKLAYELSIALERLGIAVFTGIVPVSVFLALAADQ